MIKLITIKKNNLVFGIVNVIILSSSLIGCSEYSEHDEIDPMFYKRLVGSYDLAYVTVAGPPQDFFGIDTTHKSTIVPPRIEGNMKILSNGIISQVFTEDTFSLGSWVTIFGTLKINDDLDSFKIEDEVSKTYVYYSIEFEGEFTKTIIELEKGKKIYAWRKQD